MAYHDEDDEQEREPRTLPDFYIEPTAKCGVCGVQNSLQRPMDWVCSECGEPTHTECGEDCEPSGGYDRDYDRNYWVCGNCLKKNGEWVPKPVAVASAGESSQEDHPFPVYDDFIDLGDLADHPF